MFHLVFIVSRGKWRKSFIGGASFSRPSPLFSLRYHFSTPTRWVSVSNCVPCNRIATRSIKLQEDWLSGYGFAAFAYVQMMILCYSGNKIRETVSIFFRSCYQLIGFFFWFILLNFQHEALLLALWRTKWYALPLAEQKMFILLLQQVQNGPVLTIGPYSVLDFGTAFDVSIKHIKPQSC